MPSAADIETNEDNDQRLVATTEATAGDTDQEPVRQRRRLANSGEIAITTVADGAKVVKAPAATPKDTVLRGIADVVFGAAAIGTLLYSPLVEKVVDYLA